MVGAMDRRLATEVRDVLTLANGRDATCWALVGKPPGGYQQGAYEIVDADGARAVLKWHSGHLPARQLEATAVAIESARRRGWPTAKWLAFGALANDGAYIIEEFIAGSRPTRLDDVVLERLLDAIDLQADGRPDSDQDWSAYIHRVVFEGEADLASRMRARPETAMLLRELERLTADGRAVALPSNDLVHGDFVLGNVLISDGQPYVVDTAHAGRGTRAYDLATLLMETTVGGDYVAPTLADQRRLERACVEMVGQDGFLICVACRMIHLLVFGGVHWSADVAPTVTKCIEFLRSLESAQSRRTSGTS